jgi:hypothetical protein
MKTTLKRRWVPYKKGLTDVSPFLFREGSREHEPVQLDPPCLKLTAVILIKDPCLPVILRW